MKNPLILNIRCVCIDEYMELQRIHNNYRKLRSEGEILSIYVGARRELYGQNKVVDKLLDKVFCDHAKPIPTERIMREEVVGAQGNADGTITKTVERVVRPDELPRNELMYEDEAKPEAKPEATLTAVLEALAKADDPLEAIKTEAEGEPDGADWSANTYAG